MNKKIRWYNTILMKVIFVVIISCTVVLGCLSTYNTITEQNKIENELKKLSQVTTKRLSQHLIGPMWDLDKELVEAIIKAEMLEEKIYAISIWDTETNELFSASERDFNKNVKKSNGAISGDFIQASSVVNNGSQDIGKVLVFVSKNELADKLKQATINGLLTLLALIIVMAVIISIVMNHLIITPIKTLANHADDISHGDLMQDITAKSGDEIGQLAEAFQRMQFSMRVAFKRLKAKSKATNT